MNVSIHAPTWGATIDLFYKIKCLCFNSRAHVGRDDCRLLMAFFAMRFNSRAHVGRDTIF